MESYNVKEFADIHGFNAQTITAMARNGILESEKRQVWKEINKVQYGKSFGCMCSCKMTFILMTGKTLDWIKKREEAMANAICAPDEMRVNEFSDMCGYQKSYVLDWCKNGFIDFTKRYAATKGGTKEALFIKLTDRTYQFLESKETKSKTIRVKRNGGADFENDCYLYRRDAMGVYLANYYIDLCSEAK